MFGKKKSVSDQFVMAMGRQAGNLKAPKSVLTTPPKKSDPSTATKPAVHKTIPRVKLGALGMAKKALR